jgi:hypothetical protein
MILYPLNYGDNGRLQKREEAMVRERECKGYMYK